MPLYFSTKVERISGHGISGLPFWRFSSAKTERTRAQGFTAVFGLFLVPSKHMPSAAFQRAMLHGEAPVGCCGEIRLTKCQNGWLICAHTHTDTHTHTYIYIYILYTYINTQNIYIYIYTWICKRLYIYIYVYICVLYKIRCR